MSVSKQSSTRGSSRLVRSFLLPCALSMMISLAADIEQVLREKKPFILHCMLDGIKKLQGRVVKWNRFASSVSIT